MAGQAVCSNIFPPVFLLAVAAYLLGSIPNAFLIARLKGVDIRKVGSGNVGATNVFRAVGKGWGVLTFALDALKGFVPVMFFPRLCFAPAGWDPDALAVLFTVLAVAGHNWPVWLRFKGGKGVATSVGALLGLAPAAVAVGALVWAALFAVSRIVSLGSVAAALAVPLFQWWRAGWRPGALTVALSAIGILIVVRHRANLRRLLAGTESRLGARQ